MNKSILWLLMCGVLLTACHAQTSVQRSYNGVRDLCQLQAESDIGRVANANTTNENARNATLVTLFSNCMFQDGWSVATPGQGRQLPADAGVGAGASIQPGRQNRATQQTAARPRTQQAQQQPTQAQPVYRSQPIPQAQVNTARRTAPLCPSQPVQCAQNDVPCQQWIAQCQAQQGQARQVPRYQYNY